MGNVERGAGPAAEEAERRLQVGAEGSGGEGGGPAWRTCAGHRPGAW